MSSYDDILHLPHHVSTKHPRMSNLNRAAQFSPFAALTGYEATIQEAARQTDRRIELDEDTKARLNEKLRLLSDLQDERPVVTFTCFVPDQRKDGGAYVTMAGTIKRIDEASHTIALTDGRAIFIEDIYEIDCEAFLAFDDLQ